MTRLTAALLLLFLVAPASAAAQEVAGSCRHDLPPERLPAPATLIDTAGLRDALAAAMPDGEHRDHRFRVRWDSAGQPEPTRYWGEAWREAVQTALERGDAGSRLLTVGDGEAGFHFPSEGLDLAQAAILARIIDARLLPRTPETVTVGEGRRRREVPVLSISTLHVRAGGTITLAPPLECAPALINAEALERRIAERQAAVHAMDPSRREPPPRQPNAPPDRLSRELAGPPPRPLRPSQLVLRMRIGEDGRPLTVEVVQRTRSAQLDREIAEVVRRHAQFRPATIDGIPVSVWVQLPVGLES